MEREIVRVLKGIYVEGQRGRGGPTKRTGDIIQWYGREGDGEEEEDNIRQDIDNYWQVSIFLLLCLFLCMSYS